jgi:hypothetical protein
MQTDGALLAALGIVSVCVGVLVWVIKFMFEKILPALENNNKLTAQTIELTKANTKATKSADEYLRQRNGRDNEHHKAALEAINAIPKTLKKIAIDQEKAIIKAVKVDKQSVTEQKVEHMTVNHKDKE